MRKPRSLRTINDWMEQLAYVITEGDSDALDELFRATDDWMQGRDEQAAQIALLRAVDKYVL